MVVTQIVFIVFQIVFVIRCQKQLHNKGFNSTHSYILSLLISEIILFILAYTIFTLSTGHLYPRLSIFQTIFGVWSRSLFFINEPDTLF